MGGKGSTSSAREGSAAASEATSLAKKALRARCRKARDELGDAYREQASRRICQRIAQWERFRSAGVIFTYLPMRGEVDLRFLLDLAPTAQWAIPRVVEGAEPHLLFHVYQPEHLVLHRYGMLEPDPSAPLLAPEQADLILVPALAYTPEGYRLGYGGGYYDRLLARQDRAVTLGACYQSLLLDEIPRGSHDVPVSHLVTEDLGVVTTAAPP